MFHKKLLGWLAAGCLMVCAAGATAEKVVIEDCGTCAGHVIEGNNPIAVKAGTHEITLRSVLVDAVDQEGVAALSLDPGAEVFLTVEGENILMSGVKAAGIRVPQGAKLHITQQSTGNLTAYGMGLSAGIGGSANENAGEISIAGGTVIAVGSYPKDVWYEPGTGIGGGTGAGYELIRISGGTVYAQGFDAAIGGYNPDIQGRIEISGGVVYALADSVEGECAAAIGSLSQTPNYAITISGGTVYANAFADSYGLGDAIVCGSGSITFDGGTTYAIGRLSAEEDNCNLIVNNGLVSVNGVLLERTEMD